MPTARGQRRAETVPDAVVTAALKLSRALVAVSVQSVGEVEDRVTLHQLRILNVVRARHRLNLNTVAALTGMHASNASRACDRLVQQGLLRRTEDASDRRNVALQLTREGAALVDGVMRRRRRLLTGLLGRLDGETLAALAGPLEALADAADDVEHLDEWSGAWTVG